MRLTTRPKGASRTTTFGDTTIARLEWAFLRPTMTKRHGLTKFNSDTLPTLDALYAQGMTYMAIAFQLGVSWQTVRRAILRIGTYKGMP